MSSESYTVRTAEPHEYSEVVEVLISAFDGDPAMMAIIGGKTAVRRWKSSALL